MEPAQPAGAVPQEKWWKRWWKGMGLVEFIFLTLFFIAFTALVFSAIKTPSAEQLEKMIQKKVGEQHVATITEVRELIPKELKGHEDGLTKAFSQGVQTACGVIKTSCTVPPQAQAPVVQSSSAKPKQATPKVQKPKVAEAPNVQAPQALARTEPKSTKICRLRADGTTVMKGNTSMARISEGTILAVSSDYPNKPSSARVFLKADSEDCPSWNRRVSSELVWKPQGLTRGGPAILLSN